MQQSIPRAALDKLIATEYPHLGEIHELRELSFDFTVCNDLSLLRTKNGEFVVKVMTAPEAFFGTSESRGRLELVAEVTNHLHRTGHHVEEVIRGQKGNFVQEYERKLIRVFRYIKNRHYNGSIEDQVEAARALSKLHASGLSNLREDFATQLREIEVAYPLHQTMNKVDEIYDFLKEQKEDSSGFEEMMTKWTVLTEAIFRITDYKYRCDVKETLVHTDVHPRNILFCPKTGRSTIIDFDSLMIGRPFRDLGFSALRFIGAGPKGNEFATAIQAWTKAYAENVSEEFQADLLTEMLIIEAEKAIRILYRYKNTGTYPQFLPNVSRIHLANIERILPMVER
mgnify:CR=1 FL=1